MAKKTAIIDIGSNSISIVVYEKTSRFGFNLIEKKRARVRIGEGAYAKGGNLEEIAMQKAYESLEDFMYVAKNLKCTKILCVATSALRDAPNKKEFLNRVKKSLNLSIKIIDGNKEAYFGAVAALNLLPKLNEFTTIDIGGGSTELAKIKDGKIVDTVSLNLGTVRLKELFFDKDESIENIKKFIDEFLSLVPSSFRSDYIVGIGGTIRALSLAIMRDGKYPIDALHAFSYKIKKHDYLIESIFQSKLKALKLFPISSSRYDTIREGSLIFYMLLEHLESKEVITSKAGVREGVFLSDILRNTNQKFPANFNVSIKSLIDRYALNDKNCSYVQRVALKLYDTLAPLHQMQEKHKEALGYSAKLSPLSQIFNIYSDSDSSFYFMLENLNFSFSHQEKLLIAFLLKEAQSGKMDKKEIKKYKKLLPSIEDIYWLHHILDISICINENRSIQNIGFELKDDILYIRSETSMFLCKECIKKLKNRVSLSVVFD